MGNMSYCRFENTANALRDCLGAINDGEHKKNYLLTKEVD
jgi:hypothetical protein